MDEFENETPDTGEDTPTPETEAAAQPDTEAEAAADAGMTPEEWAYTQEQHEQTLGYLQHVGQQVEGLAQFAPVLTTLANAMQDEPVEQELPEIDPFADNYQEQLQQAIDARAAQMVDQRVGPLEQFYTQQQETAGRQMADQAFDKIAQQEGDFDRDEAHRRYVFYRQVSPDTDPRVALIAAASETKQLQERFGKTAVEKHLESLKEIGGAARDAGVTGATSAVDAHTAHKGRDWDEIVAARYAATH